MFADEGAKSKVENAVWLDYGKDNYAGVTWSNVPASDGRRLFIGWMSNWQYANLVPTENWRSSMTLPRELELVRSKDGLRVLTHPIYEMKELRKEDAVEISPRTITSVINALADIRMDTPLVELMLDLKVDENAQGGILVHNDDMSEKIEIGYDDKEKVIYVDRSQAGEVDFSDRFAAEKHTAPFDANKKSIKLHILIDVSSVEVFAADGKVVLTEIFFPNKEFSKVSFFSREGSSTVKGDAWMLDPIW
ncbi:MAG: GH32 C-terminal domain-containing protein [Bacteroidia bacterium]|nr:GH32 C-terminal domain-containing protein [Bacteroidia bacterium]